MSKSLTDAELLSLNFNEIVALVSDQLAISSDQLDLESLKFVGIFAIISRLNRVHSMRLIELLGKKEQLFNIMQRYYGGKMATGMMEKLELPLCTILPEKKDVDRWARQHPRMVDMSHEVKSQELIVSFLESSLKQANNRGFAIKNAIEYKRLIQEGK